ncbi:MAG: phenylacetate--CoA ligase family protein [Terriglobia bacterium]
MLSDLRRIFERMVIGGSASSLTACGKATPRFLIRSLQRDAFRRTIRYAAQHQRFFARKLKERGLEASAIRKPEDLGDLFTTPEDLLSCPVEDFLCQPPQAAFETTGTSGPPKRLYFSYDEIERSALYEAAALRESGLRREDRVACAFDAGYWISSWVTFLACKRIGAFCSATGKLQPRDLYSRMEIYRYNVLVADPTWLVSLTEIAEREGAFPVKFIFAAGDRMSRVYRDYIEKIWKAPVILGYGSTEACGGLGIECRFKSGYHMDEYNFAFEIANPDAEGYGELVFTTLSRRTEPLIRYRARDVTRLLDEPCPCGTSLRRIEAIKGRRDEMVVMGAGNMHPAIFEEVLHDVAGIGENWQVAVRQDGLHDILEFRLELTNGKGPEDVQRAVAHNLEVRYPDVWANHACGMYSLAFRFCTAGTLSQGRKPKRLVDERRG